MCDLFEDDYKEFVLGELTDLNPLAGRSVLIMYDLFPCSKHTSTSAPLYNSNKQDRQS